MQARQKAVGKVSWLEVLQMLPDIKVRSLHPVLRLPRHSTETCMAST